MFKSLLTRKKPEQARRLPAPAEPESVKPVPPPRRDPAQRAIGAGALIKKFVVAGCQDERGIHLESALSALAALAGYSAQLSALCLIKEKRPEAAQFPRLHQVKSARGEVFVISELVNQLVASGGGSNRLAVFNLIANMGLRAGGTKIPDMAEIVKRNAAAMGSQNYPPLSVTPQHFPRETALVALRRWWPLVVKAYSVEDMRDIHPMFWTIALAYETGRLIELGKNALDPDIAMVLVMETAVAMSKVTGIGTEFPKPASTH